MLGQGLFPPWRLVFTGGDRAPTDWSEGVAFLLSPPSPSPNAYQYHAALRMHIDWHTLVLQWTLTLLVIAISCWVFVRRQDEPDTGLLKMLESRKLPSSLLVGLGLPLPFTGFPAILGIISLPFGLLLRGVTRPESPFYFLLDFVSPLFFYESVMAFAGLTGLSFLLFLVLRAIRASRAKNIVAVLGAILFLGPGILGPVTLSANDHSRRERIYKNYVTAVKTLHDLNSALGIYRTKYGKYPATLDPLGPSLTNGIEKAYELSYQPRKTSGSDRPDAYEIHMEGFSYETTDQTRLYTDETGAIRWCLACSRAHADDTLLTEQ